MLLPAPTPDTALRVFCPACAWRGTLKEAVYRRDALAVCPKCGKAVERAPAPGYITKGKQGT